MCVCFLYIWNNQNIVNINNYFLEMYLNNIYFVNQLIDEMTMVNYIPFQNFPDNLILGLR